MTHFFCNTTNILKCSTVIIYPYKTNVNLLFIYSISGNARNHWFIKTAVVSLGVVALCVVPVLPMRLKFKIAMALAVIPGSYFVYALIQNDDPFIRSIIQSVLQSIGVEAIRARFGLN